MGYIFQADVYCDDCGESIRKRLREQGKAPEDEMDHYSYDSGDYPKDADVEHEESDCPEHCAACHEMLHNPLTSAGYKYVQEKLTESESVKLSRLPGVLQEWASWYDFTYWDADDCGPLERHRTPGWYSGEMY